jgi:hypothetical protein
MRGRGRGFASWRGRGEYLVVYMTKKIMCGGGGIPVLGPGVDF